MKKAQVTIFIIIAIIIVAGIIAYFSLSNNILQKSSPEFNEIKKIVEDCSIQVGSDMTYFIGQKGGFHDLKRQITADQITYYYKGTRMIPRKEIIESEMSKAYSEMILYCLDNLDNLTSSTVKDYEIFGDVKLSEEYLTITTQYSATLISNEKTSNIKDSIETRIPSRIGVMFESAIQIIENYGEEICLSCITEMAIENRVKIDIVKPYDTTYFTITDEETQVNNVPIEWIFAYEK